MTQSSLRILRKITGGTRYLLLTLSLSLFAQTTMSHAQTQTLSSLQTLDSLSKKEERLDSLLFQAEPVLAKLDQEGNPSTAWSEAQLNYRLGDLSYVIALYKEARIVMSELVALLDSRDHRRRDIMTWDAILAAQLNELRMQIVQVNQLQIRKKSL